MSTDQKTSKISIIIPTLNEAATLGDLLSNLEAAAGVEVLVVDGGSTDDTVALAKSKGVRVLETGPGRATQMNVGAGAATGSILLFLHSDTKLPPDFAGQVQDALQQPGIVAGAFSLSIDGSGVGLRLLELLINFRAGRLQMPYGDQALFVPTETFYSVGQYPLQPLMEDFELVRRLRRRGKIKILPVAVTTSARRWNRYGLLRTTLRNQVIIAAYLLGTDPAKLADWYRREPADNSREY